MKAIRKVIFKAQNMGDTVKVGSRTRKHIGFLYLFRSPYHTLRFLMWRNRQPLNSAKQSKSKSSTRRNIIPLIHTFLPIFMTYKGPWNASGRLCVPIDRRLPIQRTPYWIPLLHVMPWRPRAWTVPVAFPHLIPRPILRSDYHFYFDHSRNHFHLL